jgi:hypothetical protein
MNSWFYKRKSIFLIILFAAFSVFTADVVDLREELRILSCTNYNLDNDISTGIACHLSVEAAILPLSVGVSKKVLVIVSSLHLLSFSFRAPPSYRS